MHEVGSVGVNQESKRDHPAAGDEQKQPGWQAAVQIEKAECSHRGKKAHRPELQPEAKEHRRGEQQQNKSGTRRKNAARTIELQKDEQKAKAGQQDGTIRRKGMNDVESRGGEVDGEGCHGRYGPRRLMNSLSAALQGLFKSQCFPVGGLQLEGLRNLVRGNGKSVL